MIKTIIYTLLTHIFLTTLTGCTAMQWYDSPIPVKVDFKTTTDQTTITPATQAQHDNAK